MLVEPKPEHQPRYDDDAAADPEQTADDPGDQSERDGAWGRNGHRASVPIGSVPQASAQRSPEVTLAVCELSYCASYCWLPPVTVASRQSRLSTRSWRRWT